MDGVSFAINPGEILGLLGPNGAGKTVTFNLISGVYKPTSGEGLVRRPAHRRGCRPYAIAALGLGRTFQIVKPFPSLSVLDNVLVARGIDRYPKASACLWTLLAVRRRSGARSHGPAGAGRPGRPGRPQGRPDAPGQTCAGWRSPGPSRWAANWILLDESFSGLRHEEIGKLEALVRDNPAPRGMTVLLIEHNMRVAMGLCGPGSWSWSTASKLAEGTARRAIQRDEAGHRGLPGSQGGIPCFLKSKTSR